MYKRVHCCIFLILVLSIKLSAKDYPDRGFYGSLNFLYSEDEYSVSSRQNIEEKFLQEFKLGYSGNIYTPKLLEYVVEGTLRYEDRDMQSSYFSSQEKSEGVDYKTKFDFIKQTKFPFSIYANKSERPVSTVYNAYSETYINETRSEGVNGTINFAPYKITYGASNMKNIVETNSGLDDSQITTYNGSISYKDKRHDSEARYTRYIENNQYNYSNNSIVGLSRVKDTVNLSYNWRGSEELMINSGASYESDEYFMSETINADLNIYWRPKDEKYDAMFSISGSNTEADGTGASGEYTFNSINISQAINYRLTEDILLSQNGMYYMYDTNSVKGSSSYINLYGTHTYNKTIFDNVPFTLTTRLSAQKNDSSSKSATDTTTTSVERYTINIMPRARKEYPSIKSTLNFDGGYYHLIASNKESEQRYDLRTLFLSRIFNIVNNNITASYSKTDRTNVSFSDGEKTKNSYSTARIMEMLDFHFNLGIRGQIRFKVGAEYVNTQSGDQSRSSVNPRADVNMNYRLFRSWQFDASARISEIYNTLDHSGSANLSFRAGKTTFLMGYQYNKSEVDTVFGDLSNERSTFKVQLTRTF